jgi:Tol biopolymer transport system component
MAAKEMKYSVLLASAVALFACIGCATTGEQIESPFRYESLLKMSYDERGSGDPVPLAIEKAAETDGSISSDGKYLAYTSDRERGNFDIYLRVLTGIKTVRLTSHPSRDISPVMSPNGKYLAFVSYRDDPQGDIFILTLDAEDMFAQSGKRTFSGFDSDTVNITRKIDSYDNSVKSIKDADPAWSPDGNTIAFSSMKDNIENIFLCDRSGNILRQCTKEGGMYPSFSPDGAKLVFVSYRDNPYGDIYTFDFGSGIETRITRGEGIKIYPSFIGDTGSIQYTLIDRDTNENGKIDSSDNSILVRLDPASDTAIPLTLRSVSSFRGRYFPVFKLNYRDSEEVNYRGIILYSEQARGTININIIPEYGIIPKRRTAFMQFELAENYLNNQDDSESAEIAYQRVYQFFGDDSDPVSQVFVARALYGAAVRYREKGDITTARTMAAMLSKCSKKENDYASVKKALLDAEFAGRDQREIFRRAFKRGIGEEALSYLRDDAATYSLSKGDTANAENMYKGIIRDDPSYRRITTIHYNLGKIEAARGGSVIPEGFMNAYIQGRQMIKDRTTIEILGFIDREKNPRKRIDLIESMKTRYLASHGESDKEKEAAASLAELFLYAEAVAYNEAGDAERAADLLRKTLLTVKQNEILFYEANISFADIAMKKGDSAEEMKRLALALNNYNTRWRRPGFTLAVSRLIAMYENKGSDLETTGRFSNAVLVYADYVKLLSSIHLLRKFEDIYNEFSPRAHVLYIDAYAQSKNDYLDALRECETLYLEKLDTARIDFNKGYPYGLGYIYLKRGAELERLMDAGRDGITDEMVIESYRNAQEQLSWATFMDDSFADPYLMQGWINQAIDLRRKKLTGNDEIYRYRKYRDAFQSYLWERNKDIYERGLSAVNESRQPGKAGSLHLNLANTLFLLGNYPKALEHYELAARLKRNFGSQKEESLFRYHLSYCYWQAGRPAEAKREMEKVLEIYRALASTKTGLQYSEQIATIESQIALYERMRGEYNSAIKWYERALADGERSPVKPDRSRIALEIAWCAIMQGNYSRAATECAKARKLIAREKHNDQEFNIRLYFFRVFGVNVWDVGPDRAVIGESRIFSPLSVAQKKMLVYSLREEIARRKGNYHGVVSSLNDKMESLERSDYEIDIEARLRTLNGIGETLFRLGRYNEARTQFEKAWKIAADSDPVNLKGAFVSIKNIVSLYGFILESGNDRNRVPIVELDEIARRIDRFREGYEKTRFEELKADIETEADALDAEVDPAKLENARRQVIDEAKTVYADCDVARAVIEYYRAEITMPDTGDPLDTLRSMEKIRGKYRSAGEVFERAVDTAETLSPLYRMKLYINAAMCREKTGYTSQAYELLGRAEKLAIASKRDDMLWEIYYREALLISKYGAEIVENHSIAADRYFRNAEDIIGTMPALYASSSRIFRVYIDHARYLISQRDAKGALSIIMRGNAVRRVVFAYRNQSVYADKNANKDINIYREFIGSIDEAHQARSLAIENADSGAKEIEKREAAVNTLVRDYTAFIRLIRARHRTLSLLMETGNDELAIPAGSECVVVMKYDSSVVVWKIGSRVVYSEFGGDEYENMKKFILPESGQSISRFILMSEDAYRVIDEMGGIEGCTWAPSMEWIRTAGDNRMESPSLIGTVSPGMNPGSAARYDIIHSKNPAYAGELIASGIIKPVVLVLPMTGIDEARSVTEIALIAGVRSVIFTRDVNPSSVASQIKGLNARVTDIGTGGYLVAGYNDFIVRDARRDDIAKRYLAAAGKALKRGDSWTALSDSFRHDAVAGNSVTESLLTRAKAYETLDDPRASAEAARAATGGDAESASWHLYEALNAGQIQEAGKHIARYESTGMTMPEIELYKNCVNAAKAGSPFSGTVPEGSLIEKGRLRLLAARYSVLASSPHGIEKGSGFSYPLSDLQYAVADSLGFSVVHENGTTAKTNTGAVSPSDFNDALRGETNDLPVLTASLEKGVDGRDMQTILPRIDLDDVIPGRDILESLRFLSRYEKRCAEYNLPAERENALVMIGEIAGKSGFTYLQSSAFLDCAETRNILGQYNDAQRYLSAISSIVRETDLFPRFTLLSAEIALFGRQDRTLVDAIEAKRDKDIVTAELLRAHAERLAITKTIRKESADAEKNPVIEESFARGEVHIRNALTLITPRLAGERGAIRRDLLLGGFNFLVSYLHDRNNGIASLHYEEMKKRFERWNGGLTSGESLNMDLPIDAFRKRIPADAVVLYIVRNGDDILGWRLNHDSVLSVRIANGYRKAVKLTEEYHTAVQQMKNTYAISTGLGELLSPVIGDAWLRNRVYIITDRDSSTIPFEIAAKDKLLAEKVSLCYLNSIYTSLEQFRVRHGGAMLVGGDGGLDALALSHAGVMKSGRPAAFGHIVTRISIRNGAPVITDSGTEFLPRSGGFSAVYCARGIDGDVGNMVAYGLFSRGIGAMIDSSPEIRDVNAAMFAQEFYSRVVSDMDIRDAFDGAVKVMIRSGKYSHPAFWAGIRLYCNGL